MQTYQSEANDLFLMKLKHIIIIFFFPLILERFSQTLSQKLSHIFPFPPPLKVRQRNELGVYLINLSVADLLYITTLPLWIDYFLQHDDWIHGQGSCKLFGFIFYTNIYVSIAFLCCISLDRYLAVAYPLRFAKVRRIKTGTKG